MAYKYDEFDKIIFKDFNDKLKKIMNETGINTYHIAMKAGIFVHHYFKKGKFPTGRALERLAELFNVQVDYFITPWAPKLDTPERTLALRVRTLMFYYGHNITDLSRKTDVRPEILRRIMSGDFTSVPLKFLISIGQYFNVSIDYLVGLKDSLD